MEIELKYKVPDMAGANAILRDEYLMSIEEEDSRACTKMDSTYFDTEDFVLAKNDVALRVRNEGEEKLVATIKWRGFAKDGLHTREEINIPVGDGQAAPDLDIFKETEIGQELEMLVSGKRLLPIIDVKFVRRHFRVDTGDCICEIALDEGSVITERGEESICELEIELFSGLQDEVIKIGQTLEEKYGLQKENSSKFAKGLTLLGAL